MAAIDGIKNKIHPGQPLDKDLYDLGARRVRVDRFGAGRPRPCTDALEEDHEYLLAGGVFTDDVIHYWIKYKRENEVNALRLRPHPYEFCMYFDM